MSSSVINGVLIHALKCGLSTIFDINFNTFNAASKPEISGYFILKTELINSISCFKAR